jgi:hypothetical protein
VLAAGGAIGLLKGTEDVLQVLVRDADAGVADPEGQGGAAAADEVGQVGGGPVDGFDPQLDMPASVNFTALESRFGVPGAAGTRR